MVLTFLIQPRKFPSPLCQAQCLTLATETVTATSFLPYALKLSVLQTILLGAANKSHALSI